MPPDRGRGRNLAGALLVIGLFFLLAESGARLGMVPDGQGPAREEFLRYTVDPDLLWRFIPGQRVVQSARGIEYRINSHGLRAPEFPARKPEGEVRILVVGDSVTFGFGVTEGCDYPRRLAAFLGEEGPGGRALRVINAGVNGWSTREELLFLRGEGLSWDPDLVILGFTLNDASPLAREYQQDMMRRLRAEGDGTGGWWGVRSSLERSAFFRLLERVLGRISEGRAARRRAARRAIRDRLHHDLMYLEDERAVAGWKVATGELREIVRLLQERGVAWVLVVFPNRYQIEETPVPDRPQVLLHAFSADVGVPCLDLLSDFRKAGPGVFIDDVHLTSSGNELAARAIGRFLRREGLFRAGRDGDESPPVATSGGPGPG